MIRNNRRTAAFVLALGLAVALGFGYEAGLDRSINGTVKVLSFLRDQIVTMLFLFVAGSIVWWVLRLNFSDDPDARNFQLQKLLTYPDGSPSAKKISLWMATLAGMYAFFYLLVHDRVAFSAFANWFLLTLFGYAGAIEVFAKREPPPPPGTVTQTSVIKKTTEVSTTPPVIVPEEKPLDGV